MKSRVVSVSSLAIAMIVLAGGCQSSRLNMPGLAFWKSNDRLAPEYIEPPSHQFNPGDTALVDTRNATEKKANIDSGDGPPARPSPSKSANGSLEAFAADVDRSWEQLAEQTRASADKHSDAMNQAMVDMGNISKPPLANGGSQNMDFAGTSPSRGTSTAPPMSETRTGNEIQRTPVSSAALQPGPGTTSTYERIASQTLSPLTPATSSTSVAIPPPPGSPMSASTGAQDNSSLAGSTASPTYGSTPYPAFQPRSDMTASAANGDTSVSTTASGKNSSMSTSLNVLASTSGMVPSSGIPSMLSLSGQGTYAPGSVRRPDPIKPESMSAPHTAAGGGEFRR